MREPVRSAFPGAPCGRGLGRTRSSGYRRERVQRGARLSTAEQLHDSTRRKALDYHGSRPVGNHSAFARRVLIEVNAASRLLPTKLVNRRSSSSSKIVFQISKGENEVCQKPVR